MSNEETLKRLVALVGSWSTEATHPQFPGLVVRGTVSVEWLEGERFLIHRARTDHPDFPDSISIIGFTERARVDEPVSASSDPQMKMHYFDSRGVFRVYEVSIDADSVRFSRHDPGFSQRFTGRFDAAGNGILGLWQVSKDDVHWADDLAITHRRTE